MAGLPRRLGGTLGLIVLGVVWPGAVALGVASTVRGGSPGGALVALAAGSLVALAVGKGNVGSPQHLLGLLVVTALIAPPVAIAARRGPAAASEAVSKLPALASALPRSEDASGYVLNARAGSFFDGGELVRVRRHRIGSWVADGSLVLPEACRLPERVDGSDRPELYRVAPSTIRGVLVASADIERVCWVPSERVVVGIAPRGTEKIEAVTIVGEEVDVPVGEGGAYVVLLEEGTIAANFVRISFRDARGALLDSKPMSLGEYANLAYLSDLIERPAEGSTPEHQVTVSKYILTPAEFEEICDTEPPHGDGFVTIAVVTRDDGVIREVVVGNGMPFSKGHPRPDPPLVRRSGGEPCFL
ncbi:MAG TPA: hypothetical protein VJ922_05935 [Actinomycetota bacterium]|nr:hypothetical protein [Actinomycetota bacterium]